MQTSRVCVGVGVRAGWALEGARLEEANTVIPGTGPLVFPNRIVGVQILAHRFVYALVIDQ